MVPPSSQVPKTGPMFSLRATVIVFFVCAIFDFALSYHDHRSVSAAIISAVGGVFGTTFYLLLLGLAWKYESKPTDDPREMARWVP
jgi:O-antigen/teichoic acid export membrane protein